MKVPTCSDCTSLMRVRVRVRISCHLLVMLSLMRLTSDLQQIRSCFHYALSSCFDLVECSTEMAPLTVTLNPTLILPSP